MRCGPLLGGRRHSLHDLLRWLLLHDCQFSELHGLHGGPRVDFDRRYRVNDLHRVPRWYLLFRERGCVFKLCLRHLPGYHEFNKLLHMR